MKTINLKNGKNLVVKIGIHTGPVISGVVGETKPQFSLIGDTVNKTSRVCSKTQSTNLQTKVSVSKETFYYLDLYTNNYAFKQVQVEMKGIGKEYIYEVSVTNQRKRKLVKQNISHTISNISSALNNKSPGTSNMTQNNKNQGQQQMIRRSQEDSDSEQSNYEDPILSSNRALFQDEDMGMGDDIDNQSNTSEKNDEDVMNMFGFNDDLMLDDRIIIQNP